MILLPSTQLGQVPENLIIAIVKEYIPRFTLLTIKHNFSPSALEQEEEIKRTLKCP